MSFDLQITDFELFLIKRVFLSFCCWSSDHFKLFGQIAPNHCKTSREASLKRKNIIWPLNHWFWAFYSQKGIFFFFWPWVSEPFWAFCENRSEPFFFLDKRVFSYFIRVCRVVPNFLCWITVKLPVVFLWGAKILFGLWNTNFKIFFIFQWTFKFCSHCAFLDFKYLHLVLKPLKLLPKCCNKFALVEQRFSWVHKVWPNLSKKLILVKDVLRRGYFEN